MVDDSGEIEVDLFKFVWYYKENLDTINKTDLLHAEMHDDPWWDLSKKKKLCANYGKNLLVFLQLGKRCLICQLNHVVYWH